VRPRGIARFGDENSSKNFPDFLKSSYFWFLVKVEILAVVYERSLCLK
jgi:hypothetical protein